MRALDADLREHGGLLLVRRGDPEDVVPRVAREAEASAVHVSADFGRHGARRDVAVSDALGAGPLVRTGSPYAVTPGRVVKSDGTPFKVFTPFYKSWREHGWRAPAATITGRVRWRTDLDGIDIPADPSLPAGLERQPALTLR